MHCIVAREREKRLKRDLQLEIDMYIQLARPKYLSTLGKKRERKSYLI